MIEKATQVKNLCCFFVVTFTNAEIKVINMLQITTY